MRSPQAEVVAQLLDLIEHAVVRKVTKPWGEEVIVDAGSFLLKLIEVQDGERTSLQHHTVKDEVQVVVLADDAGGVYLYTGGAEAEHHRQDEVVRVPPGVIHRTVGPCVLLEVTTPENDDVVRHADDYDRVTPVVTSEADTHSTKSRKPYEKPRLTPGLPVRPEDFGTGYGGHS